MKLKVATLSLTVVYDEDQMSAEVAIARELKTHGLHPYKKGIQVVSIESVEDVPSTWLKVIPWGSDMPLEKLLKPAKEKTAVVQRRKPGEGGDCRSCVHSHIWMHTTYFGGRALFCKLQRLTTNENGIVYSFPIGTSGIMCPKVTPPDWCPLKQPVEIQEK